MPDVHVADFGVGRRGERYRAARGVHHRRAFAGSKRLDRVLRKSGSWRDIKLYSDTSGDYTRDYVSADEVDIPAFNVFTRRGGAIRHFWAGEMSDEMSDPGQDPRGAPDSMPLWNVLDNTPEGRGTDWYPKLEYK